MELSIADILTLFIAGVTTLIAFATYKVSKQAIHLAKMQLNTELCLKLYELKDLTDTKEGAGMLLLEFFGRDCKNNYSSFLLSIKDKARASTLNEKLSKQLVEICEFMLKGSHAELELEVCGRIEKYSPKILINANRDCGNSDYYEALHKSINEVILKAIQELKH